MQNHMWDLMSLKRKKVEGYGNPLTFLKEHGGFFNDFIIRKKKKGDWWETEDQKLDSHLISYCV